MTDTSPTHNKWLEELASRPDISPEQLLGLFSPAFVSKIDQHQTRLAESSLRAVINQPTPATQSKRQRELMRLAMGNVGTYEDDLEDLIYQDPILEALLKQREDFTASPEFSELIRLRRTIVAHFLFSVIASADSDEHLPTLEDILDEDEAKARLNAEGAA